MLEAKHLTQSDYPIQPWKNGLGETKEVAVDNQTPYRWRLSWANLTVDGPFSPFPGYERKLVLLNGGPLSLSFQSKPSRTVYTLSPVSFQGEWKTEAKISSPGEDFNLFTLKEKAKGGLYTSAIKSGEELQFPVAGQHHFIFVVEGQIEVLEANSNEKFILKTHDTFWLSRKSPKEFLNIRANGMTSTSTCLWIVIHLL